MLSSLARLRRATVRRSRAEQEWRAAVREAVADGNSHRAVGAAAGVTHTRVQQLLRDD